MRRSSESDARSARVWADYFYADSDVFINRLGLRDRAELKAAEYKITAARDVELRAHPVPSTRDLGQLQNIHRRLFHDVYDWAGELRRVNMGRGDPAAGGTAFIDYRYLEVFGKALLEPALRAESLRSPKDLAEFSLVAGASLALVNTLHPFREGNGRAQFALLRQLSDEAGFRLRAAELLADRKAVYDAAAASHAALFTILKKEQRLPSPADTVMASAAWRALIERSSEPLSPAQRRARMLTAPAPSRASDLRRESPAPEIEP